MKKLSILLLALAFALSAVCCVPSAGTPAPSEGVHTQTPAAKDPDIGKKVTLDTVDVNGVPVKLSDYSDRKVIMINFFETWCGPCMNEIPDLVRLNDDYADKGFTVLGAFAASDESSVREIIDTYGVDYPLFAMTDELSEYQTDFVPTTIFIDADGNILTKDSFIGSRSYSTWEAIILDLLGKAV